MVESVSIENYVRSQCPVMLLMCISGCHDFNALRIVRIGLRTIDIWPENQNSSTRGLVLLNGSGIVTSGLGGTVAIRGLDLQLNVDSALKLRIGSGLNLNPN